MNGHTLYPNYVDGNVFYGTGEPKANVTLINGTIEALNGFYGVFSNNLRMYVENVNFTSDGMCCPYFNFYDYIEMKNVNISLVNWVSYTLEFRSDSLLDNIGSNGQGYLYIYNYGPLNITNSDLRGADTYTYIYTYTYFYHRTYILNLSLEGVMISGITYMKNVNLTSFLDINPVYIRDTYLDNVYIGDTQVFYCDGCYGTYEEKYIVVKNSDINVTGSLTQFVYAYNSNITINTDSDFKIGQYGGTLNAKGYIVYLDVHNTKGTVESYTIGATYYIYPFSDITLTQDSGDIYLQGDYIDKPSINLTLYGSIRYMYIFGNCNLTYNNNITNTYYDGAKLRHNVLGISVETEGNVWTDFKRYIYEVSKERVRLVDDFEYASGQPVNYTIYNLKPSTTYNVYLNGTLTYTLTSSPHGTLGPFEVTFHSPVEITVEEWQNPSWCNNLGTTILFNYRDSAIYITFNEGNPNITSVNVNFSVDGVWNNQTGLWNWGTIYDTGILNFYDGNTHTFDFEIVFLNDSTPVCEYSGNFTINPYNETAILTDTWFNETHGGFTVGNMGLGYTWQVTIWNETDYVETVFGEPTTNSSVTYSHTNLDNQKGNYDTQTDRSIGYPGGVQVIMRDHLYEQYDFTYPFIINSCGDITSPGTYYLVSDIDASGYDVCINIGTDNVVLNGMGHKIYFPVNTTNKAAVGSGWQTNVTVKNLTVEYGEIAVNGYNNTYEDINLYYGRIWTNSNSNNIILRNINFYEHPANGWENLDIANSVYNIDVENIYFNVTPANSPVMFIRSGSHDIHVKNLTTIGDGINFDQNSVYNVVLDEYTFRWVDGSCLPIYGGANGLVIKNSWIESGDGGDTEIFDSNNTIIENTNFIGGTNLNIKRCENITLRNLYVDNSIIFWEWAKDVKVLNNWVNLGITFREGWFENLDIENNEANNLAFSITSNYVKNSYIYNNNFTSIQVSFTQNSTICHNNIDYYSFYDIIISGVNDYYHEKTRGVYIGEECKHTEGILVEDISGYLRLGNVSLDVKNSIVPYIFLYSYSNVSIEDNPNIEIDVGDIGSLKQIFGDISIHTLLNSSIVVNRTVNTYTIDRVEFVDNTSEPVTLYYYVCGLRPNVEYKLYLDDVLNQTLITDSSGCTEMFPVTFHSPVKISLEYSPPPKKPTDFMKSILGVGILVSFVAFVLSLISSPEISIEGLFKIIAILTAILILILTYGML